MDDDDPRTSRLDLVVIERVRAVQQKMEKFDVNINSIPSRNSCERTLCSVSGADPTNPLITRVCKLTNQLFERTVDRNPGNV